MPRRTRAELEVENAELLSKLETVYDQTADLFEEDSDDDGSSDLDTDEDGLDE